MGGGEGRLKVDLESHLKLDLISKIIYILKEETSLYVSIIKTRLRNCFCEIGDFQMGAGGEAFKCFSFFLSS